MRPLPNLVIPTSFQQCLSYEEQVLWLAEHKQNKLVAGDNVTLTENPNGTVTISTEGGSGGVTPEQVREIVEGYGYQTESEVQNIVEGYGYQTASQVQNTVEGYGFQTASDVQNTVTGYGYQTASQVQNAIDTAIYGAMNASY